MWHDLVILMTAPIYQEYLTESYIIVSVHDHNEGQIIGCGLIPLKHPAENVNELCDFVCPIFALGEDRGRVPLFFLFSLLLRLLGTSLTCTSFFKIHGKIYISFDERAELAEKIQEINL